MLLRTQRFLNLGAVVMNQSFLGNVSIISLMRKVFQFPNPYYHGWFGSYLVVSDETLMAKIRVNKLGDEVSLFLL